MSDNDEHFLSTANLEQDLIKNKDFKKKQHLVSPVINLYSKEFFNNYESSHKSEVNKGNRSIYINQVGQRDVKIK